MNKKVIWLIVILVVLIIGLIALKKAGIILREQEVRYDSFSDEFKMKGYSFEGDGEQSLKGKSIKLFQVDKKSKLTELACAELASWFLTV